MKTKMNTQTLAIILAATFTLAACGEWKQNPLGSMDPKLQQGQEKPTAPDDQQAVDSEMIVINAPTYYSFKQEQEGSFVISATVLDPEYTRQEIIIENLKEFKGAKFDAATGKFTWKPAEGTIEPKDGLDKKMILKVFVAAMKAGDMALGKALEIEIGISKAPKVPRIISITLKSSSLREGDQLYGDVEYEDQDAGVAQSTWPSIQINSQVGFANLAPYITLTSQFTLGAGKFRSEFVIDLRQAELTNASGTFGFSLRPISRFNEGGAPQGAQVVVHTSISEPITTWTENLAVQAGSRVSHDFLIMDPKSEAKLTVGHFSNLPAGALAPTCKIVSNSVTSCRLNWDISAISPLGSGTLDVDVELKNTNQNDSASVKSRVLRLPYVIEAAPVTTTTTLPPTTTTIRPKRGQQ